jgi:hypothetical protein
MFTDYQPYRGEMTAETQLRLTTGVAVAAGFVVLLNLLAAGPGIWDRLQPTEVSQRIIQTIGSI